METYDLWVVKKIPTGEANDRFRIEYDLTAEGIKNVLSRSRRVWDPQYWSLVRKPHHPGEIE